MQGQMQIPTSMVQVPASAPNQQHLLANEAKSRRLKRVLRGLGFTQLVLGLIALVLSATLLVDVYAKEETKYPFYSTYNMQRKHKYNFGEGLWCGVWVVVTGCLGIACGRKTVTQRLVDCYMALSIFAAVFSATMFGISVYLTRIYNPKYNATYVLGHTLESAIAAIGFVSMIACCVTTFLCCCWSSQIVSDPRRSHRCCGSNQMQDDTQPRNVYVMSDVVISQRQQGHVQTIPIDFHGVQQTLPVAQAPRLVASDYVSNNRSVSYQNIAQLTAGQMNPTYGGGAPQS